MSDKLNFFSWMSRGCCEVECCLDEVRKPKQTALTERGIWLAIRDWLEETDYYDLFAAALSTARTRFNLTNEQIAAVLAESVAN